MTYKNSGVDIGEKEEAIKQLLSSVITKRKGAMGRPIGGHYAGLIEFGDYALVLCTDGVGTKVRIAEALKKYDTIGIDCIAMNVNDALCVGGETADLPELINGFDLAGTCLAYVKKNQIILGDKIHSGDAIIGLSSSGIHSNGYTLARRVIEEAEFSYKDEFPDGLYPRKTIGEIMLTPTRIYVKEIIQLFKKIDVHGLAHITGSGLWNIPRLKEKVKYVIDDPLDPQPIFTFLQDFGNIDDNEMYQIFNMGMGLAVIVADEDVEHTIKILQNHSDATIKRVGTVKKGTGVEVPHLRLHYH
jgi:phosphoribosylformylglycinamidine cyclo-ligase